MLSRGCDGFSQLKACSQRLSKVGRGGKVYCPDSTGHLVDEDVDCYIKGLYDNFIEAKFPEPPVIFLFCTQKSIVGS